MFSIAVFFLILNVGCKQGGLQSFMPENELMATVSTSAAAPPSTSTSTPAVLGSISEVAHSETVTNPAELRTYIHYPTGHILYNEIRVDDRLDNVEYICQDHSYDISKSFRLQSAAGKTPAVYNSWQIYMRPFCYIAFTVENVAGETMGIEFKSQCILCNY